MAMTKVRNGSGTFSFFFIHPEDGFRHASATGQLLLWLRANFLLFEFQFHVFSIESGRWSQTPKRKLAHIEVRTMRLERSRRMKVPVEKGDFMHELRVDMRRRETTRTCIYSLFLFPLCWRGIVEKSTLARRPDDTRGEDCRACL